MDEHQARQQLAMLLDTYTPGSVLHLLADLYRNSAEAARQSDDVVAFDRYKMTEHVLFVVGLGVDAANPS